MSISRRARLSRVELVQRVATEDSANGILLRRLLKRASIAICNGYHRRARPWSMLIPAPAFDRRSDAVMIVDEQSSANLDELRGHRVRTSGCSSWEWAI